MDYICLRCDPNINVDCKPGCGQLNLAQKTKSKNIKRRNWNKKQPAAPTKSGPSPRSVKVVKTKRKRQWRKGFVKEMSFKSGVKGWGSERWENEGGDCDEAMRARWGEPGGEWTEWGRRNEEVSWLGIECDIQEMIYNQKWRSQRESEWMSCIRVLYTSFSLWISYNYARQIAPFKVKLLNKKLWKWQRVLWTLFLYVRSETDKKLLFSSTSQSFCFV